MEKKKTVLLVNPVFQFEKHLVERGAQTEGQASIVSSSGTSANRWVFEEKRV
ncbi:MAG: hypothetical protein JEY79_05800 [Pseudodesulfovibrio sp.]|nr:hypothetical protein [Pseudodesulfovibrio sp.]